MKKLTLLLCCFPLLFINKVHAQCANADFSYGNFTNWTGSVGEHTSAGDDYTAMTGMIIGTPNSSPFTAGQQTIMNKPGTDPNTKNLLSVLPPGGSYSCRLGNAQVESCDNANYPQAAQLKYAIHVTPANAMFEYQYAVVLQNPGHTAAAQPKFTIYVLDSLGNQIGGACGLYDVYAGEPGLTGFTTCSPNNQACDNSSSVEWKNWTTVGLDLSSHINHNVILQFTAFDCIPGGHFGYAYIACSCETGEILQQCNLHSDTLWAPAGFASYSWTPGGQTTQYDIITNPVNGTPVTCVCTAVTGCNLTLHDTIEIHPVKFSVTPDTICIGKTATLTANDSTSFPYTYNWSTSQTGSTINVSPTVTTTYTVTATAMGGCYHTALAHVVVNKVQANVGHNLTICAGSGSIKLDASGSSGTVPLSYQWSNGSGNISTYDTVTVNPTATTTYTVTVTAKNGCSADTSITVNVLPYIKVSVSPTSPIICTGGSTTLSVTGAVNYTWSNGHTNDTIIVHPTTNTTYTVTGTGTSAGCSADTSIVVTVNAPPFVFINPVVNSSCNLDNGSATATAGLGTFTYLWSNGETTPTDSLLPPGLYTVTVSNAGVSGCFSTDTITIQELPSVKLKLNSIDSVTCYGMKNGSINITAYNGSGVYFYHWNTSPVQHSPTVTGLGSGVYTLIVADSVTGCRATLTEAVYQPNQLIGSLVTNSNVKCYGQSNGSATVAASGGTPSYSYQWFPTGPNSPINNILPSGIDSVIITDYHGCRSSTLIDTITQPTPLGCILTADSAKCFGQASGSVTSVDTGGAYTFPYQYLWSNTATTPNLTNVPAGSYTLTVHDHNGCTATANAVINQPQQLISFKATTGCDTVLLCGGSSYNTGSISLVVTGGTSPWSYHWDNGDTTQAIGNLPGNIMYHVTVTDAKGCTNTHSYFISQPNVLSVKIDSLDAMCKDSCTGRITSAVTGGIPFHNSSYTYSWSNGQSSDHITNLCPGVYALTITDSNGCKKSLSTSIGIKTNVLASFTASPITGYVPLNVNFAYNGSTSIGNNYSWAFGDGVLSHDSTNLSHVYNSTEPDSFRVCLTVVDSTCKSDTCLWVKVEIHSKITVPNVFTPNGDGKNDEFIVQDTSIASFNCVIFNRWGKKIYEWSDVNKGWDGKTTDGTYYYIIAAKGYDNVTYNKHGAVMLLRK
jgi:gliding motility-associated-like protein